MARASCRPGCNPDGGCPPRGGEDSELCPAANGDTGPETWGWLQERLSQSPRLLLWSACQSPDCYGGPGPATLPSVHGDLRDQCTDCHPLLVTVLSPSYQPHFCAYFLLSMLPSLLSPCLLGDKAGCWFQRHAWDCSQKCFVQNSKGLSPRMWTFLPGSSSI